ncbi:hypothetical protein DUI87_29108 [Hirundo rustica rustica]|uniref:Uncharacterized protein n=1 Tax=Hirundo rustica rustica TaxID=333673 RepID=A0A3M0J1Y2_HIRRU|nr:hypothetical protein DUI87_29108 [Hirundo rustica rustica]
MAAELSAQMQLGKKNLTGALMVGGLMQTWPKYTRSTELAQGQQGVLCTCIDIEKMDKLGAWRRRLKAEALWGSKETLEHFSSEVPYSAEQTWHLIKLTYLNKNEAGLEQVTARINPNHLSSYQNNLLRAE